MAVKFIGNVAWEPAEDPSWTVDNWGNDRVNIVFRGARILKDAFERTLQRWTSLAGFPGMKLQGWSNQSYTPNFPGVVLTYIGFRDGTLPPVKHVNSLTTQSVQGEGTDTTTEEVVSGTIVYRAARSSYTWFETSKPAKTSRYTTVDDQTDPLTRIVSYSIQKKSTGESINNVPYSSFVAIFNSLRRREIVTEYNMEEIVPGSLWGCHADVDLKAE